MYTEYFGFKENPFNLSPDPRYLFLSPQHREAMNHLLYGIHEKKGFIVITGGIGTGKTTLCRSLLADLNDSVATALVFNSAVAEIELLETIIQEFGIAMGRLRRTRKRYIDKLNEFLLRNFAAGRNAVLLIDEAQNLSHAVMEQIRMISNLETEREKILQIVLVGQPELGDLLALPSLRQLNERITVRYDLVALNSEHVRRYIEHRLNVAGGGNVIFSRGAYRRIYDQSEGNPRRINAICDRALLIAYTKDHRIIDGRIVREAVRDIGRNYLPSGWWRRIRTRMFS
ncbi:MAG: AAA family ATPase [Deltaproteobacteria bacterium]|nr:AAA family ATPase [Deltaproteobacteria bacterium]